jgi:hypothetical protein
VKELYVSLVRRDDLTGCRMRISTRIKGAKIAMPDPRRPWRPLEWLRMVDDDPVCPYLQQVVDDLFGTQAVAASHVGNRQRSLLGVERTHPIEFLHGKSVSSEKNLKEEFPLVA